MTSRERRKKQQKPNNITQQHREIRIKKRREEKRKKNYCIAKCWRRHITTTKRKQDPRYQETANVIKQTSTAATAATHATTSNGRSTDRDTHTQRPSE